MSETTQAADDHPVTSTDLTLVPPTPVPAVSQQDAAGTIHMPDAHSVAFDGIEKITY